MRSWDITQIELAPHAPEILSSSSDTRAIAIEIPAGESLDDHQVHERAWLAVLDGEVEVTSAAGSVAGGAGLVCEFDPGERHAVHAHALTRLLLLLTPWPGEGHPGAMALADKSSARERAAARNDAA